MSSGGDGGGNEPTGSGSPLPATSTHPLTFYRSEPPRRTSYASVAASAAGIAQAPTQGGQTERRASSPGATTSQRRPPTEASDVEMQAEGSRAGGSSATPSGSASAAAAAMSTRMPEGWGSGPAELGGASAMGKSSKSAWSRNYDLSTDEDSFLAPSYLRGTRYLEELEAEHQAALAARQEAAESNAASVSAFPSRSASGRYSHGHQLSSNNGTLSRSSSTVSLPKLQASHRGMAYEIIEHVPSPAVDSTRPAPLPSRWLEVDKHNSLEIAPDGQQIRYAPSGSGAHGSSSASKIGSSDHEAAAARADHPMPLHAGIYYFEIYVESKGREGMIGIGFSSAKASLEKLPGWEPDSWAYHGDDGKTFCCQLTGKHFGPTFASGDTIGCGLSFLDGTAFFTKNGNFLGTAFREVKTTASSPAELYPSVGMKRPHAHLVTNFGQRPFVFDIDRFVQRRREVVENDILHADISKLHPTLGPDDLCKALVAQYLSHDGYVNTAQAFSAETKKEADAFRGEAAGESSVEGYIALEEEKDASNRQQIRAAVLEGDIDTALSLTNTHFPSVLQANRDISFRVRCRKFIEMMLQSAELRFQGPPTVVPNKNIQDGDTLERKRTRSCKMPANGTDTPASQPTSLSNGTTSLKNGAATSNELSSSTTNTTSATPSEYSSLISHILSYGQLLSTSIATEPDPLVRESQKSTVSELFGMLSYPDARTSPQARWPETSRVKVAEGLNSAILVSLGRKSATAIETIFKQAWVLEGLSAEDGGEGSIINVGSLLKDDRAAVLASVAAMMGQSVVGDDVDMLLDEGQR